MVILCPAFCIHSLLEAELGRNWSCLKSFVFYYELKVFYATARSRSRLNLFFHYGLRRWLLLYLFSDQKRNTKYLLNWDR